MCIGWCKELTEQEFRGAQIFDTIPEKGQRGLPCQRNPSGHVIVFDDVLVTRLGRAPNEVNDEAVIAEYSVLPNSSVP